MTTSASYSVSFHRGDNERSSVAVDFKIEHRHRCVPRGNARIERTDVDRNHVPSPGAGRVLRMAFLIAITLEDIDSPC